MSEAEPLWRGEDLDRVLGLAPGTAPDVTGIAIDSRTLRPGELFVALAGDDPRYRGAGGGGRDGHDFVADAGARGAAAAVVARPCGSDVAELVVDDPFDALWALARAARERFHGQVFALTGSSGKTTAKSLLAVALPAVAGITHAAEGSFNNHIGVPLSLARLPAAAAAAVFEIGMNSPGEIAPLARLVRPAVALVLNVLPVHLEGLGSLEAIRREKLAIAEGLDAGGVLVVHEAVDVADRPASLARLVFGRAAEADVRLEDAAPPFALRLPTGRRLAADGLPPAPHRRLTAAAVVTCLVAAGLDPEPALPAMADVEPPPGRGGRRTVAGVTLVDDSYNANPESVRHALAGLRELPARRRWALLGDMLELGPDEERLHAELASACAGLDGVICVGARMRALYDRLPPTQRAGWWPECPQLDLDAVVRRVGPGDALLVKGSNRLFWKHGTVAALAERLTAAGADDMTGGGT